MTLRLPSGGNGRRFDVTVRTRLHLGAASMFLAALFDLVSLFVPWWSVLYADILMKQDVYICRIVRYSVDSTWMFFFTGTESREIMPTSFALLAGITAVLLTGASISLILGGVANRREITLGRIFAIVGAALSSASLIVFIYGLGVLAPGIPIFGAIDDARTSWGLVGGAYFAIYATVLALFGYMLTPASTSTSLPTKVDRSKRSMHFCFVTAEYMKNEAFGGIATYVRQIATEIASRGHQVTILTISRSGFTAHEGNLRVFSVRRSILRPATLFNTLRLGCEILRINKLNRISLVEAPEWTGQAFVYGVFRKIFRSLPPLVVRLHGPLWALNYFTGHAMSMGNKLVDFFERESVKLADYVSSPSRSLAELTRRYWGITKQIDLLPNGISVQDSQLPKQPAGVSISLNRHSNNHGYILFLGKYTYTKGVLVLAKAIPLVVANQPSARFVFAGRDEIGLKKEILKHIPGPLRNAIAFRGTVDGKEKTELMRNARIMVIPSLYENFPMVCLEAMALGKIVVASAVGGLVEIIDDEFNGFLVSTNDSNALAIAILKALSLDDVTRASMQERSRNTVLQRYDMNILAPRAIDYYSRVCGIEDAP